MADQFTPPPPPLEPEEPQFTPSTYATGALKQDPATLAVAVRTNLPAASASELEWGVMTVSQGGYHATWMQIKDWVDIPNTPVPPPPDEP